MQWTHLLAMLSLAPSRATRVLADTNGDKPMSAQLQNVLIVCVMLGFALMEFVTRRYQVTVRATSDDTKLELLQFLALLAIAQPTALLVTNQLCLKFMPEQHNALAGLPWWAMFGVLLLADDLTQYLWHRASHSPMLWPLHRAHHTAQYMSIRITYRNNFFYYLLMPGLWIGGVLIFLGFGKPTSRAATPRRWACRTTWSMARRMPRRICEWVAVSWPRKARSDGGQP
jgi:sterol desaturase/sphingolipid hydroxylase (fatty acid hydroxylase superfamily)